MKHSSDQKFNKYDLTKKYNIQDSFALVKQITREYAKTFYYISKFLPRAKRRASFAIYAFCRQTDNFADEYTADSIGNKQTVLQVWKELTKEALETGHSKNLILDRYVKASIKFNIPRNLAFELISGVETDLTKKRYDSFLELEKYCYLVASVPGLMFTHIIGFNNELAIKHAIFMGKAMQLTNILRDIKEDFENGRIYLPKEDLVRFHISESDLAVDFSEIKIKMLVKDYIKRSRDYYDFAFEGIQYLNQSGRFGAKMAGVLYSKILDEIENQDLDVFAKRAYVSYRKKLVATFQAVF